jgi:hypothetical protein
MVSVATRVFPGIFGGGGLPGKPCFYALTKLRNLRNVARSPISVTKATKFILLTSFLLCTAAFIMLQCSC